MKEERGAVSAGDAATSDRKGEEPFGPLSRLLAWSGPNRVLYLLSVILAVIGVAGNVVPYYAAGQMVIGVLGNVRELAFYGHWCLVAFIGHMVYVVCHNVSTAVSHAATFNTIARIRCRLADKLARVPMGYVLDTSSGKLKNIMVEKVDGIETALAHVVPEMTSDLLVPILVVIYLFSLNWVLALASLATIPIGYAAFSMMMVDYDSWYGRTVVAGNEMSAASVEYVNGIEVIKAFGRSASSYDKFSRAVTSYAHSFIDWMAHCQIWQDLGLAVAPATLVTVLPIGCGLLMLGAVDAPTLVLVAILSIGIFPPLYAGMSFFDSLAQVGTTVEQIADVLEQPEQRRAATASPLEGAPGEAPGVELERVRFSYGREEVIHGVDLAIRPGRVTALVGPSGSGKSTLARLVAGFWDPAEGSVRIGGTPLAEMTSAQLASLIAYVDQDSYLFDRTIMDNIRIGCPDATDVEVMAVAKASGCHEFIEGLAHGYQTVVGDSGGHLSGGERQRISIARAMMKDAPVVILDEATAYTDPESEAQIEAAVSRLVRNKTLIVIAHRLSTITDADQIVVVDAGRIQAQGTHDELMVDCPLYAEMYRAHMDAKDGVA